MYTVTFSKQATKTMRRLPRNVARLISDKVDQLTGDPESLTNQVKKLTDHPGYRLRISDCGGAYQ
ncbi:addiction module toxin, RelE/StbE family protein [Ectothiorhodospira sp. PHS-1]|nr:addiction module toxin, RelE/StbE family protein [Ectothiorhodospira sp. PHS-1]